MRNERITMIQGILQGIFPEKVWYLGLFCADESTNLGMLNFTLLILATIFTAYILGSVNTAVILSKLIYREDIRTKGSGNAGMTNMMRTYGKGPAALTLLGDMLKAMLGMITGTLLLGINGAYLAGLFCVIGHVIPIFYRFKGGKGVASSAMVLLYIDWRVFLIILSIFILITWATKYLSLASVLCMAISPLLLNRFDNSQYDNILRLLLSLAMSAVVVFMHRSNIKRIMNGTENKFKFKKTVKANKEEKNNDPYLKK